MFEWVLKRYSLISLVAIFSAAPSDSPKDEDTPVKGRRAPNVTVCCFKAVAGAGGYGAIVNSELGLEKGKRNDIDENENKEK
jgi:hypothetical protein